MCNPQKTEFIETDNTLVVSRGRGKWPVRGVQEKVEGSQKVRTSNTFSNAILMICSCLIYQVFFHSNLTKLKRIN